MFSVLIIPHIIQNCNFLNVFWNSEIIYIYYSTIYLELLLQKTSLKIFTTSIIPLITRSCKSTDVFWCSEIIYIHYSTYYSKLLLQKTSLILLSLFHTLLRVVIFKNFSKVLKLTAFIFFQNNAANFTNVLQSSDINVTFYFVTA